MNIAADQTFREQTAQQGHSEVKDLSGTRDALRRAGVLYHIDCLAAPEKDEAMGVVAAGGDICGKCGKYFGEAWQKEAEAQRASQKASKSVTKPSRSAPIIRGGAPTPQSATRTVNIPSSRKG